MEIRIHDNETNLLPPADWAIEIRSQKEDLINGCDRNLLTMMDFQNDEYL